MTANIERRNRMLFSVLSILSVVALIVGIEAALN